MKYQNVSKKLLEGTAAMLYAQSMGGWWWHLLREDVREKWRARAAEAIAQNIIAGGPSR